MKNAKCASCKKSNFSVADNKPDVVICSDCYQSGNAASYISELESIINDSYPVIESLATGKTRLDKWVLGRIAKHMQHIISVL